MTAPVRPESSATGGMLHRILTPDEFHQAQQLPPEALAQNPFPILPPAAPSDATRRLNPNAGAPDKSVPEQLGEKLRNSSVGQSKGLGGILVRQVVAPIIEHPYLTGAATVATAAIPPLGAVWLGMMGKDVLEYSAQKAAETSLDPDTQRAIENDPEYQASRISGEQAGVEAATLGLTGIAGAVARARAGKPVVPSLAEATHPIRQNLADFVAPEGAAERRGAMRDANTDALTGLGNQRAFNEALPAAEADPNTHVIRFDANGFKAINDTHGHEVGDQVLARIGETIRAQAKDLPVFRTGGDEFAVFAPKDQAPAVRDAIENAVGLKTIAGESGAETPYSLSGGIGNTNAEADQAAIARKAEHKAVQRIPNRDGTIPESIAANVPAPEPGARQPFTIPDEHVSAAGLRGGPISVPESAIEHIAEEHGDQLAQHGYGSAPAFVDDVLHNYNAVYRDKKNPAGVYLVKQDGHANLLVAELQPTKGGTWEVKSGRVMDAARLARTRELLWEAPRSASTGPGSSGTLSSPPHPPENVNYALSSQSPTGQRELGPQQPLQNRVNPALQQAVTQHVADVTDALQTMAPVDQVKSILRANLGDAAGEYEHAAFKVDEFRRAIDWLPENDKLGFVDAIEHGASQPSPEFQPLADFMRNALDAVRDQIRALGTGKLEQYIQNYFPHSGIWANPEQAETTFQRIVGGRRPMEGTKSFLKERSVPTVMDGVKNGLELAEGWNPIDVFLSNYRDMQRYLFAHRSFLEAQEQGLVQFVRAGERAPEGYTRINDKIATVFGKPTVTVTEAFDANQRAAIEHAIDELGGVTHTRKVKIGGKGDGVPSGALGYAKGTDQIVTKFGTHDGVLMHELGHIVDNRYGLAADLAKAKNGTKELTALADLRAESSQNVDPMFRNYLQKPEEQAANALHAYLHAPERMQEVAPNVYKRLDAFLSSRPELEPIKAIKPSVELATRDAEVPVGGMVIRGEYWAPREVATVFNNHLSPGLPQILRQTWGPQWGDAAARAFDLYRGLGNTLNQAQLGFSAFHLGMTSLDATVSRAALGLEEAAAGNFGAAAANVAKAPLAPIPGLAQGLVGDFLNHVLGTDVQMGLGAKLRQAYLTGEGSPEMVQLAQYLREAGGRVTMDSYYKNSAADQWMSALREQVRAIGEGRVKDAFAADWRAGKVALPALLELASKPIMEHVVPLQKLQVFGELAQKVVRDLPPDATLAERRVALQKAWDSVDNRMGQLVYDNLFWNRTFKDLAMASTRSVGWNLGTIRELGGGIVDAAAAPAKVAKGEALQTALTHRAAYAITLPVMVGLYGAIYQYLRTGEAPSELKDYFYPKTGEQDGDGNDERVQLPSYMKDLAAYAGSPWQTITHKVAPLPNLVYEMLQNEDFYGDQIRNPLDPAVKQIGQEADFIAKSALPFTVRNNQEDTKRGDQSTATKFGNWFGVTPAPRRRVRSDAQNLMGDMLASRGGSGGTPEEAQQREERAALLRGLRGIGDIDIQRVEDALNAGTLTPADIGKLMKRAGLSPAQEKFKSLTTDQALQVFDKATDREKALFADALTKKLSRLASK